MLVLGAWIAGLVLLLREAIPWARALATGAVRTRGHRREWVRRAEDPERFKGLVKQRFKAMGLGAICLAVAFGWTLWSLLNLVLSAAP